MHEFTTTVSDQKMETNQEIIFAWEAAQVLGLSSSKFLRTVAEEIPHQSKGGVRLYKRDVVERWREKRITSGV